MDLATLFLNAALSEVSFIMCLESRIPRGSLTGFHNLTKAWTLRRGVWIWKETLQDFGDLQKFESSKMELGSEMADYKTPLSKSVLLLAFYYPSGLN